ncbi:hypothetical protein ACET3Z_020220 [Daucus carota]
MASFSKSFCIVLILLVFATNSNKVVHGGRCDKGRRAGIKGGGSPGVPCTNKLGLCNGSDDNMCDYDCRHDDYPLGYCGECVKNDQGTYDCICHTCY